MKFTLGILDTLTPFQQSVGRRLAGLPPLLLVALVLAFGLLATPAAHGATPAGVDVPVFQRPGGEANLVIPDLNKVQFFGFGGHDLLLSGFLISILGLGFGAWIFLQLRAMPVHKSMLEVSELIYTTCKAYMIQQGKFLAKLFLFIGTIAAVYFGVFAPTSTINAATGEFQSGFSLDRVALIIAFAIVGVLGSYGVAWYGIRVNTFANSRTAFASLRGKPFPCYAIPLKAGMSIGMMLISVELFIMLAILLLLPSDLAGSCLIGFAIGESLGAAALRIAGGIFTKIADIGSDLMKIVFKIKEDDARNPGVIADCVGDNAGDSVGPSADGFETYGVTGVALIVFTMIAVTPSIFAPKSVDVDPGPGVREVSYAYATSIVDVGGKDASGALVNPSYLPALDTRMAKADDATKTKLTALKADASNPAVVAAASGVVTQAQNTTQAIQVKILVWLFMMRIIMVIASALSYFINEAMAKAKYGNASKMDFEHPLTVLVVLTSVVSIVLTYAASWLMLAPANWEAIVAAYPGNETLATLAKNAWWILASIISCGTAAGAIIPELVKAFTSVNSRHVREVVKSSEQGGASLNILSGLVAGNFSAYWLGMAIILLMSLAYAFSLLGLGSIMLAPAVFAFGLVAFGFLSMGPVTIAVDSYGPVTDNAQSVYELSTIEAIPGIEKEIEQQFGFKPDFEKGKDFLEENDGAGNTFKATAKPVLIGTAVVGATTMIFSIIVVLTGGLQTNLDKLSLLHAPFLLGLITGGAVIYWFTGASTQAVTTGAYRAVEFIKANIKLDGATKASVEDSKKVVTICTEYAQKGMFNIFLGVFFGTLAFAFIEPFFFIGYLIGIALFGLYQAMFMANAGGAWDNAKKIVETDPEYKGTGRGKGSDLHAACVVGDTVGDPFKDTSSVALNPVIKFTTLFGLLAVELAIHVKEPGFVHTPITIGLSVAFLVTSMFFVYRSFYGMMIKDG